MKKDNFTVAAVITTEVFFDIYRENRDKTLPIELAAVKVKDGEIADTFSSFIGGVEGDNRSIYLDEAVSGRTGITDFHLISAPAAGGVFSAFKDFIGGDKIVAESTVSCKYLIAFAAKFCGGIHNEVVCLQDTPVGERLKEKKLAEIFDEYRIMHIRNDSLSRCIAVAQLLLSV